MLNRKIRNLSIIILIQALLISGLLLNEYRSIPETLSASKIGLDSSIIKKAREISIKQGNSLKLTLIKSEEQWLVNGKPADSGKVNDFLDSILSMSVESDLGPLKNREREFSLDKFSRYVVEIKSDKKSQSLIFGKPGPTLHSRYLVLEGSNNVYLVSGAFTDEITKNPDDWREKRLIRINNLKRIEVETTSTNWSIDFGSRSAEINYQGKTLKVEGEDFERLKIDIEGAKADGFIDDPTQKEERLFKNPEIKLTIFYTKERKEIVFAKKDSDYYLAKDSKIDYLFLVPDFNLDIFLTNPIKNYSKE
ncbi:MAG: DUF4340 domain-containing protein [Actinobacteria bacterium]|nr:DUF4340 domain-containing protein [Actinomycetota bacterium]